MADQVEEWEGRGCRVRSRLEDDQYVLEGQEAIKENGQDF